jgi:hypothetical protein
MVRTVNAPTARIDACKSGRKQRQQLEENDRKAAMRQCVLLSEFMARKRARVAGKLRSLGGTATRSASISRVPGPTGRRASHGRAGHRRSRRLRARSAVFAPSQPAAGHRRPLSTQPASRPQSQRVRWSASAASVPTGRLASPRSATRCGTASLRRQPTPTASSPPPPRAGPAALAGRRRWGLTSGCGSLRLANRGKGPDAPEPPGVLRAYAAPRLGSLRYVRERRMDNAHEIL